MKKRLLAVCMAAAMVAASIAGCAVQSAAPAAAPAESAAEQTAEAELIKAQKAAEAKRVEADALAYYNEKVAQNYQVETRLKELEIQLERAKRWDGREVPNYLPITAGGTIVDLTNN